jgi:hypothetical protein
MTICPVALAVGCKRCPVFKVCPVKSTLGDYRPESGSSSARPGTDKTSGKQG